VDSPLAQKSLSPHFFSSEKKVGAKWFADHNAALFFIRKKAVLRPQAEGLRTFFACAELRKIGTKGLKTARAEGKP